MGLIKLAVYGALGYLAYQMFFSDASSSPFGARQGDSSRGNRQGSQSRGGNSGGGSQSRSGGGSQSSPMTGGGEGRLEETQEPAGTSMKHRVGRGVI